MTIVIRETEPGNALMYIHSVDHRDGDVLCTVDRDRYVMLASLKNLFYDTL